MKSLIIVESPTKVKTIEKYLGDKYTVVASVGHVRDLPKSEKNAIDIENDFTPNYIISEGKDKIINEIKRKMKESDKVILATDPDREGESIAWHIEQLLKLDNPDRIVFNEITKEAIIEALKNPRKIDQSLRKAQEARRVLDRLFGYTLSKLIWSKVRYGLSAGRVQSPALRIIMEKEREIRKFNPVVYHELTNTLKDSRGKYITECEKTFEDKKEVDRIINGAKRKKWIVSKIKSTIQERKPKPPFITSTIQQAANSYFGWTPYYTMRVAQKLYEDGTITYMRTDSTFLSKQALDMIKDRVVSAYGNEYYKKTIYNTKTKSAQEAHEAIRPTDFKKMIAGTTPEGKKLYNLIYSRTVSSQMINAQIERKVISFSADDMPTFLLRGIHVKKDGWFKASPSALVDDVELPDLKENDELDCVDIFSLQKQTTPPNRYSEAGLVKELESRGIGRPSTYASIIQTLIQRSYVEKDGRSLVPTDLGDVVSTFVENNFKEYISDTFTSKMETVLDDIATGNNTYEKALKDFYFPFNDAVNAKQDIPKLTSLGKCSKDIKCPICDEGMEFKLSRNGTFMSCVNYPDCIGARTKEGAVIEPPKPIGKDCPKCGEQLIKRTGKYGDFISCEKYPKCKYVEEDPETKAARDTGIACSDCSKGTMIEKKGKYGIFYGCSEYPKCKFAMKARPIGEKCTMCGSLMMEGTKTIPNRCSKKICPMHNPHKL